MLRQQHLSTATANDLRNGVLIEVNGIAGERCGSGDPDRKWHSGSSTGTPSMAPSSKRRGPLAPMSARHSFVLRTTSIDASTASFERGYYRRPAQQRCRRSARHLAWRKVVANRVRFER